MTGTMKTAWRSLTALALLLPACWQTSAAEAARGNAARPNILLIISDDIGLDANTDLYPGLIEDLVKQYGPEGRNHPQYRQIAGRPASTPTLNALAQSGMRFTQAWAQPFCSPTRVSMITGLFSLKTGVLDYYNWATASHRTLVHELKEKAGYTAAAFGKWHMAGLGQDKYPGLKPKEAGFDLYRGNLNGAPSTYWTYEYHVQDDATLPALYRTGAAPTRSLPGIGATTYAPVTQVADALQWISEQEAQRPGRPWLAWVAFNNAHITENQQPNPMAVPNIDTLDEPTRREMQACGGQFGSANVGRCTDKALHRALTNSMDTLVGHLLRTVEGLDPNTYVIFVGDNGTWMFGANREFIDNMYITRLDRSKGSAYESGVRVPLLVRGPGVPANSSSDVPVHAADMFATVLSLAGLEVPATVPDRNGRKVKVDGVSFAPVLRQDARQMRDPYRDAMVVDVVNPTRQNLRQSAARNARYKVLCTGDAATANCEFYDLVEDPLEEYKLATPASCGPYRQGSLRPEAREWNFCRLQEVLAGESALSLPASPRPGA